MNEEEMMKFIKIALGFSFIIYLFALAVILFLGNRGFIFQDSTLLEYIKHSTNLVPFSTITLYIQALNDGTMNAATPIRNLLGNLILFLPMGIYLPFFFKRLNKVWSFGLSMAVILFAIEAVQLLTRRGSFDIDDFILNLLGAFIGLAIWRTDKIFKRLMKMQKSNNTFS